jgi:hypothetical protein
VLDQAFNLVTSNPSQATLKKELEKIARNSNLVFPNPTSQSQEEPTNNTAEIDAADLEFLDAVSAKYDHT